MHNFVRSDISIEDLLNEVGSRLRGHQNDFFIANKDRLKVLFAEYNEKAANNALHTLVPEWKQDSRDDKATKNEKAKKKQCAYRLYGSKRRFVNELWEELTAKNGGDKLYCPICGLNYCKDMDHFVPRDVGLFPEYSAHTNNLIPLCHDCNLMKWNKFLDSDGERLYFNAYYDLLPQRNILVCDISLSPDNGDPQIVVNVDSELSETNVPDKYIRSTIKDLKLLDLFNAKAKEYLKKEMVWISKCVGRSWEVIKDDMTKVAMELEGDHDMVYPAVLRAIANSAYMEEWFTRETDKK